MSDLTAPAREPTAGSVLFVTAVRLRRGPQGLQIDDQTAAGLCRWAEHFRHVTFGGILIEREKEEQTSVTWIDVKDLACHDRLSFVELPFAYRITSFFKQYRATRRRLAEEIRKADHLCFTLGYLFGDWAGVAALEAISQNRRYAAWIDRVEHDILRNEFSSFSFPRRMKERLTIPVMIAYHRYLTRRSAVGLFQGRDTYNAYARYSSNPNVIYDVHTQKTDRIPAAELQAKLDRIVSGGPLRICYAGRMAPMKGPEDWIDAIGHAIGAGVPLKARWLGDGPLFDKTKANVHEKGLDGGIVLEGYVSDRATLFSALRDSDLFVFCHKTPESPRCLIEALVCGCPIVGYRSAYPEGLVEEGGGVMTPPHDPKALGQVIADLDANRPALAELVRQAARAGERFDEETVYAHRARLVSDFT